MKPSAQMIQLQASFKNLQEGLDQLNAKIDALTEVVAEMAARKKRPAEAEVLLEQPPEVLEEISHSKKRRA